MKSFRGLASIPPVEIFLLHRGRHKDSCGRRRRIFLREKSRRRQSAGILPAPRRTGSEVSGGFPFGRLARRTGHAWPSLFLAGGKKLAFVRWLELESWTKLAGGSPALAPNMLSPVVRQTRVCAADPVELFVSNLPNCFHFYLIFGGSLETFA